MTRQPGLLSQNIHRWTGVSQKSPGALRAILYEELVRVGAGEGHAMNTKALWNLTYGVYVIGSRKGDKLNGQIANTVFQVTSEPPAVAVSINKNNLTHDFIRGNKVFTASTLCEDTPLSFIGRFGFKSGRDINKLEGVGYKFGETKAPIILDNAISYVEVRVDKEVDVGTHTIFIGEVVAADVLNDKACMTYAYYQQVKRGVTPKTAPTYRGEKGDGD